MRSQKGFTLLEAMAALAIMGVVAAASLAGLDVIHKSSTALERGNSQLGLLSLFFARMERDMGSAVAVNWRRDDTMAPPMSGGGGAVWLVHLSSKGPGGAAAPSRVGYEYSSGRVDYLVWETLDGPGGQEPERYTAIEGVSSFSVSFLDEKGSWLSSWREKELPRAVKASITMVNGDAVWRVFDMP